MIARLFSQQRRGRFEKATDAETTPGRNERDPRQKRCDALPPKPAGYKQRAEEWQRDERGREKQKEKKHA